MIACNGLAASQRITIRDFFNMRLIGFALIRSWGFLMIFGAITSPLLKEPAAVALSTSATIASFGTLIAAAFAHQRIDRWFGKPSFKFVVVSLCPVGAGLTFVGVNPDLPLSWMPLIAGGIANGLGSSFILLGYGELYSKTGAFKAKIEVPWSLFIASLAFAATVSLPLLYIKIIVAAFPLASALLLFLDASPPAADEERATPIHADKFVRKLGACVVLVGIADGLVRAAFMSDSDAALKGDVLLNPCMLSCVLMMLIMYPCLLITRKKELQITYRSISFAMAAFFMLLPTLTDAPLIRNVVSLSAYETFTVFIWILLTSMTSRLALPSTIIFGLGWGLTYMGNLIGMGAGACVAAFKPLSPEASSFVVFLAVACILSSYFFIFNEKDLESLVVKVPGERTRTPFRELCASIAEAHQLTPREAEIMMLAAKGRSITRIQEDLHISRGTAATHMRHIFQKLDIHSKQELLDLIEKESQA